MSVCDSPVIHLHFQKTTNVVSEDIVQRGYKMYREKTYILVYQAYHAYELFANYCFDWFSW